MKTYNVTATFPITNTLELKDVATGKIYYYKLMGLRAAEFKLGATITDLDLLSKLETK